MVLLHRTVAQLDVDFKREPENLTVEEHTSVAVPCITNTTLLPSWSINGMEYSSEVGLPVDFALNITHLIISDVALHLNNTVLQCFFVQFVSNVGVVRMYSQVGVIIVTKGKFEDNTNHKCACILACNMEKSQLR